MRDDTAGKNRLGRFVETAVGGERVKALYLHLSPPLPQSKLLAS